MHFHVHSETLFATWCGHLGFLSSKNDQKSPGLPEFHSGWKKEGTKEQTLYLQFELPSLSQPRKIFYSSGGKKMPFLSIWHHYHGYYKVLGLVFEVFAEILQVKSCCISKQNYHCTFSSTCNSLPLLLFSNCCVFCELMEQLDWLLCPRLGR